MRVAIVYHMHESNLLTQLSINKHGHGNQENTLYTMGFIWHSSLQKNKEVEHRENSLQPSTT